VRSVTRRACCMFCSRARDRVASQVAKHKGRDEEGEARAGDVGREEESGREGVPPSAEEVSQLVYKQTELGLAEERRDEATFDMFGEEEAAAEEERGNKYAGRRATAAQLSNDEENWDDGDGYYMARPGEVIESRYRVLGVVGRGVFSSVLRAKSLERDDLVVAVKMIRNNETMTKAAVREVELLRDIAAKDPDDRAHCVRLVEATQHRGHTALVFESMAMNLREALRKYGKDVGINVVAVQKYGRQLLAALRHLRRLGVVHADVKPDNILVSENNAVVKLCDFGSAFRDTDPSDPAPYLVSRFYRAPEIILGLKYDHRIDLWSLATCLFELYAGRVMFPGADNNAMLAKIMDLKGRFPVKMLKAHVRVYQNLLLLEPHFRETHATFKFQHRAIDKRTNEPRLTLVDVIKPKTSIAAHFVAKRAAADDPKTILDLADLLEHCTALNPDNRPSVSDAAKHRFILPPVLPTATTAPKPSLDSAEGTPAAAAAAPRDTIPGSLPGNSS